MLEHFWDKNISGSQKEIQFSAFSGAYFFFKIYSQGSALPLNDIINSFIVKLAYEVSQTFCNEGKFI